jgi:hypothetical protein
MRLDSEEARARAEAKFKKKAEQAKEGEQAWVEYKAKADAVREKTARLRALRLATPASTITPSTTSSPASALQRKGRAPPRPAKLLKPQRGARRAPRA